MPKKGVVVCGCRDLRRCAPAPIGVPRFLVMWCVRPLCVSLPFNVLNFFL
jgi:hypothetical protein